MTDLTIQESNIRKSIFEELKKEHLAMFPDTHQTRYDIYEAWFKAGWDALAMRQDRSEYPVGENNSK